jgi:hypothetical protein
LLGRGNPVQSFLKPLLDVAETSDYLVAGSVGEFEAGHGVYQIPRFIFMGPSGGGDTIRLGLFATFYGDQIESAEALIEFAQALETKPQMARGYHLYIYPICNPTGFVARSRHNFSGEDLPRHFWHGSSQPEVYYLEREMGVLRFHGVIQVQTQRDSEDFALNINSSAILARTLTKPAIQAAQRYLAGGISKSDNPMPDFFPRDFLTAGHELNPTPFELHLGVPGRVPRPSQIHGTVSALISILDTYRNLQSIGQNI